MKENDDRRPRLTTPEVAEMFGVTRATLLRWIKEGKLEAIQFGPRCFRVPEDAIPQFLRKVGYGALALTKNNGRNHQ